MADVRRQRIRDPAAIRSWWPEHIAPPSGALLAFRGLVADGDWNAALALACVELAPPKVDPSLRKAAFGAAATSNPAVMAALATLIDNREVDVASAALYLVACSASDRPPDLTRASALAWSNAFLWIMDACDPELMQRILAPLLTIAGQWSLFADLAEMLARAPARHPADTFADDPDVTMQLAIAPGDGSGALLVCICGRIGRIGMPVNLFHRWAGATPADVLYLRGEPRGTYREGIPAFDPGYEPSATLIHEARAALGVDHVAVYGSSAGGFPALKLGLLVGARRIVVAAGLTRAGPRVSPAEQGKAQAALAREVRQLVDQSQGRTEILCIHARDNRQDRADAEALSGIPGVRLLEVAGAHHNVARPLVLTGALGPLLDWAAGCREDLPQPATLNPAGPQDER